LARAPTIPPGQKGGPPGPPGWGGPKPRFKGGNAQPEFRFPKIFVGKKLCVETLWLFTGASGCPPGLPNTNVMGAGGKQKRAGIGQGRAPKRGWDGAGAGSGPGGSKPRSFSAGKPKPAVLGGGIKISASGRFQGLQGRGPGPTFYKRKAAGKRRNPPPPPFRPQTPAGPPHPGPFLMLGGKTQTGGIAPGKSFPCHGGFGKLGSRALWGNPPRAGPTPPTPKRLAGQGGLPLFFPGRAQGGHIFPCFPGGRTGPKGKTAGGCRVVGRKLFILPGALPRPMAFPGPGTGESPPDIAGGDGDRGSFFSFRGGWGGGPRGCPLQRAKNPSFQQGRFQPGARFGGDGPPQFPPKAGLGVFSRVGGRISQPDAPKVEFPGEPFVFPQGRALGKGPGTFSIFPSKAKNFSFLGGGRGVRFGLKGIREFCGRGSAGGKKKKPFKLFFFPPKDELQKKVRFPKKKNRQKNPPWYKGAQVFLRKEKLKKKKPLFNGALPNQPGPGPIPPTARGVIREGKLKSPLAQRGLRICRPGQTAGKGNPFGPLPKREPEVFAFYGKKPRGGPPFPPPGLGAQRGPKKAPLEKSPWLTAQRPFFSKNFDRRPEKLQSPVKKKRRVSIRGGELGKKPCRGKKSWGGGPRAKIPPGP